MPNPKPVTSQKPPLPVKCFRCNKEFGIKWVPPLKRYSRKNNWEYWTGEKEEADKQICDNCLINLYRNEKPLYFAKIKDAKKRDRMRNYITNNYLVAS